MFLPALTTGATGNHPYTLLQYIHYYTMGRIITFNVTCMGASHVKSGKPCQDYSLNWQSDDGNTHVAIVCDGHGGETYVRSDRGSRLAAEISLKNIRNFVENISPKLFLDKEAAVTARPENEEDVYKSINGTSHNDEYANDEEDIRKQQNDQNRKFFEAVEPVREQDQVMQRLFACIYTQWMTAIEQDAQNNPFTDWEKSKLNGARIAKAYGTTLMAFVRTPLYWFAFHIGDGKMLCCDTGFNWREPVPWDCNCFLNITTSLCLREPLHSFRYAFNGKGDFPAAVIMGSDGLDDSWVTMDNLKNFYSQTLSIFNNLKEEETVKEMKDYLPRLSEKGSRDDMSMAGIIDMDAVAEGSKVFEIQKELNTLFKERKAHEEKLAKLKLNVDTATSEHKKIQGNYDDEKRKEDDWLNKLMFVKSQLDNIIKELEQSNEKKSEAEHLFDEAKKTYDEWLQNAKTQKAEIEQRKADMVAAISVHADADKARWEELKENFLKGWEENRMEVLSEKVANMNEVNDEAVKGIQEATFEPEVSDDDYEDEDVAFYPSQVTPSESEETETEPADSHMQDADVDAGTETKVTAETSDPEEYVSEMSEQQSPGRQSSEENSEDTKPSDNETIVSTIEYSSTEILIIPEDEQSGWGDEDEETSSSEKN